MEERAHADVEFEEPEPPLPRRGRPRAPRWRSPAAIGASIVVVLGVGVAVGFLIGPGGAAPAATASSSPPAVDVHGEIRLAFIASDLSLNARDEVADGLAYAHVGDPCTALGGYSDISAGTAVTIGGSQGQTLAVGALSAGSLGGQPGLSATCDFTFSVQAPGGQSLYTVTISHRGTQTVTPADLADGITLTLSS